MSALLVAVQFLVDFWSPHWPWMIVSFFGPFLFDLISRIVFALWKPGSAFSVILRSRAATAVRWAGFILKIAGAVYFNIVLLLGLAGMLIRLARFPVPVVVLAAVLIISTALYWLRCRNRFIYGFGELGVAVVTLNYALASPTTPADLLDLGRLVAVAGAMYIWVRGLDNMANNLPESWKASWYFLFRVPADAAPLATLPEGLSALPPEPDRA